MCSLVDWVVALEGPERWDRGGNHGGHTTRTKGLEQMGDNGDNARGYITCMLSSVDLS